MRLTTGIVLAAADLLLVVGVSLILLAIATDAEYWWLTLVLVALALLWPFGATVAARGLATDYSDSPATQRLLATSAWLLFPAAVGAAVLFLLVMTL